MPLGGFNPFPLRLGGGKRRLESIYKSLCESRGTAYDVTDDSNVTAELHAEARALDAAWSGNRRLSYCWDPFRMTDMIPRWEKIFDLHPGPDDSIASRREALQPKFLALIGPGNFDALVQSITGASFVGIEYTPLSEAVPRWPANGYPDNWTSNCSHILIRVQFAPNQTFAEYWNMRALLTQRLNDVLPAYTTFDIGHFDSVTGLRGFYLDRRNLNYSTFRV